MRRAWPRALFPNVCAEPAGYRLLQADHDAGGAAQLSQRRGGSGGLRCRNQGRPAPVPAGHPRTTGIPGGPGDQRRATAFLERIPFLAPDFIPLPRVVPLNPRYVQTGIENDEFFPAPERSLAARDPLRSAAAGDDQRGQTPRYPAATVEQARERLQESSIGCAGRPAPRNWPASRWPTLVPAAASPIGSTRRW